jgi:hypothetical protein
MQFFQVSSLRYRRYGRTATEQPAQIRRMRMDGTDKECLGADVLEECRSDPQIRARGEGGVEDGGDPASQGYDFP